MLGGDETAFVEFVERYSKALYRFTLARLESDRELTRDIVQIAITKALGKLDTYRGESSLLSWLCACCRNEILMHWRRRRAAPLEVELEDRMEPATGAYTDSRPHDPERALLGREEAHRVHLVLDALPPHYAQALEWKYVEHLPVNEIAARLGSRPKAAESLLTRARQAFRVRYESMNTEREDRTSTGNPVTEENPRHEPARSRA